MKLTRDRLKQIIKEELQEIITNPQGADPQNHPVVQRAKEYVNKAKEMGDSGIQWLQQNGIKAEMEKHLVSIKSQLKSFGPSESLVQDLKGYELALQILNSALGQQTATLPPAQKPQQQALPRGSVNPTPPPNKVGNNNPQNLRVLKNQLAALQKTKPSDPRIADLQKKIAALGG